MMVMRWRQEYADGDGEGSGGQKCGIVISDNNLLWLCNFCFNIFVCVRNNYVYFHVMTR